MTTNAGREVPDVPVREETDVGMTEGRFERAIFLTAGTGNVGDTKETTITPAMADFATRTDIILSPVTMATDDGLCSAAEQKEAVRVTVEGSVGAAAGVTADSTPVVAKKHAKPSPKIVANNSSKEVKQTRSVSKAQVHHQGKAPVCNDFLLFRIWASKAKINNSTELINEVEYGYLIIVR